MTKTKKGFTLIELVVVMAIIAVLAALMVVAIAAARRQATNTQIMGDTKAYETALETYSSKNNGKYPGISVNKVTDGGALGEILKNAGTLTAVPASTSIYYYTAASAGAGTKTSNYVLMGCPDGGLPASPPTIDGTTPSLAGLCKNSANAVVDGIYVTAR